MGRIFAFRVRESIAVQFLLLCCATPTPDCSAKNGNGQNGECSAEPTCKDFDFRDASCDIPTIYLDRDPSKVVASDKEAAVELSKLLKKKKFKRMHPVAALTKMHWRSSPVMLRGGGVLCNISQFAAADSSGDHKLPATVSSINEGNTISWNKGKLDRGPTGYTNMSFTELAKILSGSLTEDDLGLPAHWQGRLFPQSRPRAGFVTEKVLSSIDLQSLTMPGQGEPLLDFGGSGFWAESKGTRTAFHTDGFIQVVIPCWGTKLWHLIPGPMQEDVIPGTGAWVMTPKLKELEAFAWLQTEGPFSFCANGSAWKFSSGHPPKPKSCFVSPGDILYLPQDWAHDVYAQNSSVHITFRFSTRFSNEEVLKSVQVQEWVREHRDEAQK